VVVAAEANDDVVAGRPDERVGTGRPDDGRSLTIAGRQWRSRGVFAGERAGGKAPRLGAMPMTVRFR
jgi:hypothetical protein